MKRAVLVCPGRGSYTERELRSLPSSHPFIERAEALRVRYALEPLAALDRAERFSAVRHLRPANASPLIWLISMIDAEEARRKHELVAVAGNSMGWYTALCVAGALSFEHGFRLVQEMALLQERGTAGGQVLYPRVDARWRPDPAASAAIEAALASAPGEVFPSIHLGGYAVLAGSPSGVTKLQRSLPPLTLGKARFPLQLALHGPYHTPLASDVARSARESLAALEFRAPEVPLIDGLGRITTPWSADPAALHDYTLGAQIDAPYDFSASVRVALREFAPERLVLPGPGNTLGGICGQVLVAEGWGGLRDKDGFDALQGSDAPLVESMRR